MIKLKGLRISILLVLALFTGLALAACTLMQGIGSEESAGGDTWVIEWHREGGIAGFCDDVTIHAAGMATLTNCRVDPEVVVGEVALSAGELATIEEWQATYASRTYDQSDPAIADAMTIHFVFIGRGDQPFDEAAIQSVNDLAQAIIRRAN